MIEERNDIFGSVNQDIIFVTVIDLCVRHGSMCLPVKWPVL